MWILISHLYCCCNRKAALIHNILTLSILLTHLVLCNFTVQRCTRGMIHTDTNWCRSDEALLQRANCTSGFLQCSFLTTLTVPRRSHCYVNRSELNRIYSRQRTCLFVLTDSSQELKNSFPETVLSKQSKYDQLPVRNTGLSPELWLITDTLRLVFSKK